MRREATGRYESTSVGGETVRAFVPFPLPPEPPLDLEGSLGLALGLALGRKGMLLKQTKERLVIGDDDGERAITLRLRQDHRQAADRLAKELGMSRNEFLLAALEHFVDFLEGSRDLLGAEE